MWGTTPISQVFSTTAPPTTDTSNTIETFGQQPNTLYRTTDISLSGVNSPDTNLCGEYIVPTDGFLLNNISPGFSGDSSANSQDLGNNMMRSFQTYGKPGKYAIFDGVSPPPNAVEVYIVGAGGGCGARTRLCARALRRKLGYQLRLAVRVRRAVTGRRRADRDLSRAPVPALRAP